MAHASHKPAAAQAASGASPTGGGRKPRPQGLGKGLWLALAALALAGGVFLLVQEGALAGAWETERLWRGLFKPLISSAAFIAGGLLAGQLIEGLGFSARLGVLVWPLIRRAHLPQEAGAAFSAAFASGVTANTLLYTAWQEGRLDKRQLVMANLLNAALPAYFLHLPTTFFVVYALLGNVALVYFGLTLLAALLRTLGVVLLSRIMLPARDPGRECVNCQRPGWRALWASTWPKFHTRLRRMLLIVLPVYVVFYLLAQAGFFAWLSKGAARWAASSLVPVEAMGVVVFAVVAEFNSGFAAAAALLQAGSLTFKQVVLALILGNLVATPVRALRHQLPHYMGIYAPGLGVQLLSIGQASRVLSVALVGALYAWWA